MVLYVRQFLVSSWYLSSRKKGSVYNPIIYFRKDNKSLFALSPTYFPNRHEATVAGIAMGFEVVWEEK